MDYRTAAPDRYGLLKEFARENNHIMRFTNEEVLYDTENVLEQIENYFIT